jgi:hypothetical protein
MWLCIKCVHRNTCIITNIQGKFCWAKVSKCLYFKDEVAKEKKDKEDK